MPHLARHGLEEVVKRVKTVERTTQQEECERLGEKVRKFVDNYMETTSHSADKMQTILWGVRSDVMEKMAQLERKVNSLGKDEDSTRDRADEAEPTTPEQGGGGTAIRKSSRRVNEPALPLETLHKLHPHVPEHLGQELRHEIMAAVQEALSQTRDPKLGDPKLGDPKLGDPKRAQEALAQTPPRSGGAAPASDPHLASPPPVTPPRHQNQYQGQAQGWQQGQHQAEHEGQHDGQQQGQQPGQHHGQQPCQHPCQHQAQHQAQHQGDDQAARAAAAAAAPGHMLLA